MVYDLYASSENAAIAYEIEPVSGKYFVTIPETLMFIVKNDGSNVSEGEVGEVIITNLYRPRAKPWMVLLNYKIKDQAMCLEKNDEIVTFIGDIRREVAYLAGAKLDPTEVEAVIEGLGELRSLLSGEYCVIAYNDEFRRAVAEVRLESRKPLTEQEKERISQEIRSKIYRVNFPVWDICENVKDGRLVITVTEPGQLYKSYEHLIKPGKPKRLLKL